ncbi:hypothetical protein EC968_008003 [Mortierella alpina]|nr:hypothetical protein EC968_008003 [Mortierella alpina]
MRRESRASHRHARAPLHHQLTMATRLALFHRILSTTKSVDAQTVDKETWIVSQSVKRGFPDRTSFESAMASHTQALVGALTALGGRLSVTVQQSPLYLTTQSDIENQEMAIYNTIQTAVDAILENAHWLCGPDFEMGINRICPQWTTHEASVEHIVHYVQVVESMRETLSGRFHHPQDLSEDLTRSQEVIDYQRTLFGETLRSHGLEWKALGLPPMEGLIQETQDWILNLAMTLTVKIRAEMTLALENSHHHRSIGAGSPCETDMMEEEFHDPGTIGDRSVDEVMDMVLQGALLSVSCLELGGKSCPALVTAWMELAGQYCMHALHRRKQHILRASRTASMGSPYGKHLSTAGSNKTTQPQLHQRPQSGMSRGVIMKTMELFENVSRLLQCVQEMREEEEACQYSYSHRGTGMYASDDCLGDYSLHGISSASSDQDEPMDFISATPASGYSREQDQYGREPVSPPPHQQRSGPVDSFWLQRWMAMESLASTLVETGLELCESMAEILGSGYTSTSLPSSKRTLTTFNPALSLPASLLMGTHHGLAGGPVSAPTQLSPQFKARSSSARAQAAIASLTGFAGGGVMASGTGGVGLIYVQFVVRILTKMIEFAGQDSQQELQQNSMETTPAEPSSIAAVIPTLEDQILQLADHEAWLDAQIRELEFAAEIGTTVVQEDGRSTTEKRQELEQRIDFLKQELTTAVSMETVRNKVVDSAHAYQVVLKSLFKGDHDQDEKSLANAIEERDEAVSKYLHIHRELQKARRELSAVQVQVLDCQDDNRAIAQSLALETAAMKEAMASQDSKSSRRMAHRVEEELRNIVIKHSVVSNVLQGLLLESGIDWANDPHYLEVMLKLRRTTE